MRKILIALALISTLFISGCSSMQFTKNIKQTRDVENFENINITGGGATIYISSGNVDSVTVQNKEYAMNDITTEVKDGILELPYDSSVVIIVPIKPRVTYYITAKNLKSINCNVDNKIILKDFKQEELNINATDGYFEFYNSQIKNINIIAKSDSNDFKIDIPNNNSMENLNLTLTGHIDTQITNLYTKNVKILKEDTGNLRIKNGEADKLNLDIKNKGKVEAKNLEVSTATVLKSNEDNASLFVKDKLTLNMSGSGDIVVYGNPEMNLVSKTDSGELIIK
jgi:hypothetical protein